MCPYPFHIWNHKVYLELEFTFNVRKEKTDLTQWVKWVKKKTTTKDENEVFYLYPVWVFRLKCTFSFVLASSIESNALSFFPFFPSFLTHIYFFFTFLTMCNFFRFHFLYVTRVQVITCTFNVYCNCPYYFSKSLVNLTVRNRVVTFVTLPTTSFTFFFSFFLPLINH